MTLSDTQKKRIRRRLGAPDSVTWRELSTNCWALQEVGRGYRADYYARRGVILWARLDRRGPPRSVGALARSA